MKRLKTLSLRVLWKKLISNWKTKYRLVIKNDSTHQEKLTFRLSPRNVFVLVTTSAVFLITITAMLIAFTPLRVYVPGYTTPDEYREYKRLALYVDSVDLLVRQNQQFLDNFYNVINDRLEKEDLQQENQEQKVNSKTAFEKSKETEKLEQEADAIIKNYRGGASGNETVPLVKRADIAAFFPKIPTTGRLVSDFSVADKHYGIDIQNNKNTPVSSIEKGMVVFAGFDPRYGNTIIIQHAGNIISKYQNLGNILKKVGDKVESEEVIAQMGHSGSAEKGIHLHLELWYNGFPVNPLDYLTIN